MNEKLLMLLGLGGLGVGLGYLLWTRPAAAAPAPAQPAGNPLAGGSYGQRTRSTYRDLWGRLVIVNDTGLAGEESGAQDYNDVYYKMCRQPDGSFKPCLE